MNKMKHILPLFIGVMMTCIISCVNVDIIDGTERATTSLLRLSFNWNGEEADKPQYLQLISVRNVMNGLYHRLYVGDAQPTGIRSNNLGESKRNHEGCLLADSCHLHHRCHRHRICGTSHDELLPIRPHR